MATLFGLDMIYVYAILGATSGFLFLYFIYKYLRPITRVLLLSDEDGRLDEIKVDQETSRSLKQTGRRKWFKFGRAFLSVKRGRRVTTYLGKRGTAYTWRTEAGEIKRLGTFWDALNVLWDKKLIEKIPVADADKLKSSDVYVTVKLEEGVTPEGFEPITEDSLQDEADKEMAMQYAEGAKGAHKTVLLPLIMAAGSGGLLTMIALGFLGWLRIGGGSAPPASSAVFMVLVNLI